VRELIRGDLVGLEPESDFVLFVCNKSKSNRPSLTKGNTLVSLRKRKAYVGGVRRVASVDDVSSDFDAEVTTDGSRLGLSRVGGTNLVLVSRDESVVFCFFFFLKSYE